MSMRTWRLESGLRSCSRVSLRRGCGGGVCVIVLAVATLAAGAMPCFAAGLVIEAPTLTATPGSTGSFDLLLTNTNPTGGMSYQVSSDQFMLSLSGPLGITFTGVTIDTVAAPYIYVMPFTTVSGTPLSTDTFPNTQFTGADLEFATPAYRTVDPGDTFGLAHVSYAVSSSTPNGIDTISIAPYPGSFLTDEMGNSLPFGVANGLIAVGVVVPEPWALTQAATAVLIGAGLAWRRRRGRRKPT